MALSASTENADETKQPKCHRHTGNVGKVTLEVDVLNIVKINTAIWDGVWNSGLGVKGQDCTVHPQVRAVVSIPHTVMTGGTK